MQVDQFILTIFIAIVGGLTGSFAAQLAANQFQKKSKYKDELKEITTLLAQTKEWMNNEHIEWSRSHWFGGRKDNTSEKFKCPIDFIEALVATTEPSLIETISKMANEVDTMRNMPEHIFLDIGSTDIENDGNNWDRVNKCYKRFEKYYADAFSIIKSRIWKRNTK